MPELTQVDELATLRTTNAQLLQKSSDRKAKIAEHELTIRDLTAKLTAVETALRTATVEAPLCALAATLSPVPELWLTEFAKHYKVEQANGKLQLQSIDGTAVMDGTAEIEFTAPAILKLLTKSDDEALASFAFITRGSMASGGGATSGAGSSAPSHTGKQQQKEPKSPQFGLR